MMAEGRVRNGNGISEPMSASKFRAAGARRLVQPLGEKHQGRNAAAAAAALLLALRT